jgi:hypothetical protein
VLIFGDGFQKAFAQFEPEGDYYIFQFDMSGSKERAQFEPEGDYYCPQLPIGCSDLGCHKNSQDVWVCTTSSACATNCRKYPPNGD